MDDSNRTQLVDPPTLDANKTLLGGPTLNATQTIKPIQCPVCKERNPAGVMFCVSCGLIFDRALPDDAFGAPAVRVPMLIDEQGRENPLRPGETVIGREGDIAIADGRASRRHAVIRSDGSSLTIEDLGSTNGTVVDGSLVAAGESRTLTGGEDIAFGGVKFKLAMPDDDSEGRTKQISGNKTAALSASPTTKEASARLIGGDYNLPLHAGLNTFGRTSANDVVIGEPFVSSRHGVIELADDGPYITDVGSTNGTMLDDAKLLPNVRTLVLPEHIIKIGSLELRIEKD